MDEAKEKSRGTVFVEKLLKQCADDTRLSAAMRRAVNPALEPQCWPWLVRFGVNVESASERAAFVCVGAALIKGHVAANGSVPFGRALAKSYEADSPQAEARLRRLLACDSVQGCTQVLRALIPLVQSRCQATVDYAALLDDLLRFRGYPDRVRAKWTMQFFGADK